MEYWLLPVFYATNMVKFEMQNEYLQQAFCLTINGTEFKQKLVLNEDSDRSSVLKKKRVID